MVKFGALPQLGKPDNMLQKMDETSASDFKMVVLRKSER